MPKLPDHCTVVLSESAGNLGKIVCRGEIVRAAGGDPFCIACGAFYRAKANLRATLVQPDHVQRPIIGGL